MGESTAPPTGNAEGFNAPAGVLSSDLKPPRRETSRMRAVCTLGLWNFTLLGLLVACCTMLAPHGWIFDLIAMLAGPGWCVLGAVCVVAAAGWGRWGHAGVMLLSVILVGWIGVEGRRLLPHALSTGMAATRTTGNAEAPADHESEPRPIRILQVNLHAKWNDAVPEALDALVANHADVVVMTEFPAVIWEQMRTKTPLSAAYPHLSYRDWVKDRVPGCVVLSRWPIRRIEPEERESLYSLQPGTHGANEQDVEQVYLGRVESPWGEFVLAQITPQSPRSAARWARGNEITRAAAAVLEQVAQQGEVVALACDLNSTPFGVRGRVLRDAGLNPSKPVFEPVGSWPATAPGVLRVAIDDVWIAGSGEVVSWRLVELPGSDHYGVEVGLVLKAARGEMD